MSSTTNQQNDYAQALAVEVIGNFEAIASEAKKHLQGGSNSVLTALASGNSFADSNRTVANALSGQNELQQSYHKLKEEPAIVRLVAYDEAGEEHTFYITRLGTVGVNTGIEVASYHSPIGRLASIPVGDEVSIQLPRSLKTFEVLERAALKPSHDGQGWDSKPSVVDHIDLGLFTVNSFRWHSKQDQQPDLEAEIMAILSGDAATIQIREGLYHQVRSAMVLRDQPILDQFQDEIFRLPLNEQLIILGPPGTGKTTTLIKRLGQKINPQYLNDTERKMIEKTDTVQETSWVMFTPSDLLKHYLQEAFNREQVPASDERVTTWAVRREYLAKNVLGLIPVAAENAKFIFRRRTQLLNQQALLSTTVWFDEFDTFHQEFIKQQLQQGYESLKDLNDTQLNELLPKYKALLTQSSALISLVIELERLEGEVLPIIESTKKTIEDAIQKTLKTNFQANQQFIHDMARHISSWSTLELEDELDASFDEDEDTVQTRASETEVQQAVRLYQQTMRTLARVKYTKRSIAKNSAAGRLRDWLGKERLPSDELLISLGELAALQNALRRFMNTGKRYLIDVPASYKLFRKDKIMSNDWYQQKPTNNKDITAEELDGIILLQLRIARELMSQPTMVRRITEPKFGYLKKIADQFKNQVLVDEATDFSPIQLACMESLTNLHTKSFFACGDINQRITNVGIRNVDQLSWVAKSIKTRRINTIYRQSAKLNQFANQMLTVIEGDLESKSQLPEQMHHDGVEPVFVEHIMNTEDKAKWIAERIIELKKMVRDELPSVAVLVSQESDVREMAKHLTLELEEFNARAVACADGQVLGNDHDVRVFDVQHIKGLEFEAVFFVDVDKLESQLPDLYTKYLYVGATRAATYFGVMATQSLPSIFDTLKPSMTADWKGSL
jgi:DNA helicase IV